MSCAFFPLPYCILQQSFIFYILCSYTFPVQVLSGRNQLCEWDLPIEENFCLILGQSHFPHWRRVMVQIKGMGHQVPLTLLNFLQRKLKQLAVIRLKFYHAFFCQNPVISFQKLPGKSVCAWHGALLARDRKNSDKSFPPLPHQKQGEALLHPCV